MCEAPVYTMCVPVRYLLFGHLCLIISIIILISPSLPAFAWVSGKTKRKLVKNHYTLQVRWQGIYLYQGPLQCKYCFMKRQHISTENVIAIFKAVMMSIFLLTASLSAVDTIFTVASTQLKDSVTGSCNNDYVLQSSFSYVSHPAYS